MDFEIRSRGTMDHPDQLATAILDLFFEAHKLIGIGAILTDGTAGTIESVRLDDDHGLRISIRGHHPVPKLKKFEGEWRSSESKLGRSRPDLM